MGLVSLFVGNGVLKCQRVCILAGRLMLHKYLGRCLGELGILRWHRYVPWRVKIVITASFLPPGEKLAFFESLHFDMKKVTAA